jgi:hypothetical protein
MQLEQTTVKNMKKKRIIRNNLLNRLKKKLL